MPAEALRCRGSRADGDSCQQAPFGSEQGRSAARDSMTASRVAPTRTATPNRPDLGCKGR